MSTSPPSADESKRSLPRTAIMVVVAALAAMLASVATASSAAASVPGLPQSVTNCAFAQPTSYIQNFDTTAIRNAPIQPRPNGICQNSRGVMRTNADVTVHARSGSWVFIQDHDESAWGWVLESQLGSSLSRGNDDHAGSTTTPAPARDCSWRQPSTYVPNYQLTASGEYQLRAQSNTNCATSKRVRPGHRVTVHAESGDWRFIENHSTREWGWVHRNAFGSSGSSGGSPAPAPAPSPAPASNCSFLQPSTYVPNYELTASDTYQLRVQPNTNCATSKRVRPGHRVTVHAESGDWRFIENHSTREWGWVHKGAF